MLKTFRKLSTAIVTTGLILFTLGMSAQAQCGMGGHGNGGGGVGVGLPQVFIPTEDDCDDDIQIGSRIERGSFSRSASKSKRKKKKKKKGRTVEEIELILASWGQWVPIAVYRGNRPPKKTTIAELQAALIIQEGAEFIRGIPGTGGNDAASSIADLMSADGRPVYILWGFLWKTGPNKGQVTDIHGKAVPQTAQTPWESKGEAKNATQNKIEKSRVINRQRKSLRGKMPRAGTPKPGKG